MTDRIPPEFGELVSLARDDVNFAKAVCDLLEGGLPILEIDTLTANPAVDGFVTYHLPDRLKVLLATVRAEKVNAVTVPVRG